MDDSNYYERQAQVVIEEARAARLSGDNADEYRERIIMAIRLLILSDISENG